MRDKTEQIIDLNIDGSGLEEGNPASSTSLWDLQDPGPVSGAILGFPDSRDATTRRLGRAFEETFTSEDRRKLCGFDLFSFPMGLGGRNLRIDDNASIDLVPGSPDYRFTISTRSGNQALLVTTDARLMADFVRQYLLARVECRPELEVQL